MRDIVLQQLLSSPFLLLPSSLLSFLRPLPCLSIRPVLSRAILSIVIAMTVTMEQSYETRIRARLRPARLPY